MKNFFLKSLIFSLTFTICLIGGLLITKAWSGIKATNGDKVTTSKWNELVGYIIKENGATNSTINGTYCGSTASAYDGAGVGGYIGAKSKCELACGDTLAHMCDAHEIFISKGLGLNITNLLRFSALTFNYNGANYVDDCAGWTSNGSTRLGYITSSGPNRARCNSLRNIACCK